MVAAGHGWITPTAACEHEGWELSGLRVEVLWFETGMHQLGELGSLEMVAWSGEAQANVGCPLACGRAQVRNVTGFRERKRAG